jgi:hypothetical protein
MEKKQKKLGNTQFFIQRIIIWMGRKALRALFHPAQKRIHMMPEGQCYALHQNGPCICILYIQSLFFSKMWKTM